MDPELQELNADPDESAGFNDDDDQPTERPAADEVDEPQTQEVVEPEIEYVQLTKAEVEEFRALKQAQEKSFGTAFGKIGGIERDLQSLKSGKRVDIKPEAIAVFREDFPEIADALEQINGLQALPGAGFDPAKIDEMVQQRIAPALSAVEQKFELRLLAKDHPDYAQVDADPAFKAWIAAQPAPFQQALATASTSFDSSVVSDALSRLKAAKARPQGQQTNTPTRNSRMTAAVTPRGSGATRGAVSNDEASGFDAA